jgi:hypothetical protein
MGGNLLVPEVYNLDAFVGASFVKIIDMPSVERKNVLDAFLLKRLGEQVTAIYLCHFSSFYLSLIQFAAKVFPPVNL